MSLLKVKQVGYRPVQVALLVAVGIWLAIEDRPGSGGSFCVL